VLGLTNLINLQPWGLYRHTHSTPSVASRHQSSSSSSRSFYTYWYCYHKLLNMSWCGSWSATSTPYLFAKLDQSVQHSRHIMLLLQIDVARADVYKTNVIMAHFVIDELWVLFLAKGWLHKAAAPPWFHPALTADESLISLAVYFCNWHILQLAYVSQVYEQYNLLAYYSHMTLVLFQ